MCLFGILETGEGYFLAPKNEPCSHNWGIVVDNANSCEEALNELKRIPADSRKIPAAQFYDKPIENKNMPKGCYLHLANSLVYFNTHSTGSSTWLARQICKPKGNK